MFYLGNCGSCVPVVQRCTWGPLFHCPHIELLPCSILKVVSFLASLEGSSVGRLFCLLHLPYIFMGGTGWAGNIIWGDCTTWIMQHFFVVGVEPVLSEVASGIVLALHPLKLYLRLYLSLFTVIVGEYNDCSLNVWTLYIFHALFC